MRGFCTNPAGWALTRNQNYNIIGQDSNGRVEVVDDQGYKIWVSADCFRF